MARKTDRASDTLRQNATPENAPAASEHLPLFYRQPRPLDVRRHAQASLRQGSDYGFAQATNSIPLNAVEFIEAVRHYPIVFTASEQPMPVAIVGLEQTNYFMQPGKGWKTDAYVPAYARQYPFVLMERPREEKFYLCVDEDAPQFALQTVKGAMPFYNEDGSPSALTQHALQYCTAFYNHHQVTRHFCDDLARHALLVPYQSEATLPDGKKLSLSGFRMIDEKRFNDLPNTAILEFRQKGWLPFIYLALASAVNWKTLPQMAVKESAKKART
jgi:hypothetical protein